MYQTKLYASDKKIIAFLRKHDNKWMSTAHMTDYIGVNTRTAWSACKRLLGAGVFDHKVMPLPNRQGFIHQTDLYRLSDKSINDT